MMSYLKVALSRYVAGYSGLSSASWRRASLTFMSDTAGGIIFFMSFYFVKVMHINVAVAGLIISCYGLGTVIGGITGGRLSDEFSPRIVSLVSLSLLAIFYGFLAEFKTAPFLMAAMFIFGFANYGFITSNNLWVIHQYQHNEALKLKAINVLYTASNLGIGTSAVLVSILERYGFVYLFACASILCVIAIITLLFFDAPMGAIMPEKKCFNKKNNNETQNKPNKKVLILVLVCLFIVGLMITQRSTAYLIYLHDQFPHLGIRGLSFLFALNPLIIVVFQASIVNYFRDYNKLALLGVGAFLMGLGMFVLSFSVIFALTIVSCVIYTLGEMLFFSVSQLLCYNNGGQKRKGQALGIYKTVFAISTTTGPSLGGYVFHHFGGNANWYLCGLMGLMCLMACDIFRKKHY